MIGTVVAMPDSKRPLPPLTADTVGGRVREAYRAAGYNRHAFAGVTGISYQTLIRWEQGVSVPSLGKLRAVCQHTGYSLKDLEPDANERIESTLAEWDRFMEQPEAQAAPDWALAQIAGADYESEPTLRDLLTLLDVFTRESS